MACHAPTGWRLLVDAAAQPGAANMSVDQALLDDAARSGTATLRLYRWDPPCLSFGRNEPAAGYYDRAEIQRLGIDVVRRPTGGRAVWHEHEVTYAVAAPIERFRSLREAYCAIHERIAAGLRALGVETSVAPTRASAFPPARPGSCFDTAVGGEILVRGRKLVGSAQVRQGSALLQHGSILLAGSQEMIRAVSRQPSDVGGATTLSAELGRPVMFEEVAEAILRAWGESPLRRLRPPYTALHAAFRSPAWTWRR